MTSPLISEALMEATWTRVGSSTPAEVQRLRQACEREQKELTHFVFGLSSELRREAAEVALYLYVVISEAFRKSGPKFKPVKPGKIVRAWETAKATIVSLPRDCLSDRHPPAQPITPEPVVFRYVAEALTEDSETDPVCLTGEECWQVLTILQTVSDCLHGAARDR